MEDSDRVYVPVGEPDRAAFEAARVSLDQMRVADELVALAFHDPDATWVQEQCLRLIGEEDASEQARYIAVVCLDHLLRIHHCLDFDRVLPVIHGIQDDVSESVRGAVQAFLRRAEEYLPFKAYLPLPEPDQSAYRTLRGSTDRHALLRMLLALSRDEDSARFAESECCGLLEDDDEEARRVALIGLRNVFVVTDRLDFARVNPLVRKVRRDPVLVEPLTSLVRSVTYRLDVGGYSPWVEPDREKLTSAFDRADVDSVGAQLTALALEDPSWRWVQDVCLRLLRGRDPRVRILAVRNLENLVYFRRVLDRDAVVPVLRELRSDEALIEPIEDFFSALEAVGDER